MKFRNRPYELRNLHHHGKFWWVNITKGKERIYKNTYQTDVEKAMEYRDKLLQGREAIKGPVHLTVRQAMYLYLKERRLLGRNKPKKVKRTLRDDVVVFDRFLEFLGDKTRLLASLEDDGSLDGFELWLIKNYPKAKSIHRRNRHFKILSVLFNWSMRRKRMKSNPVHPYLDELETEEPRDRFLSVTEYFKLLRECSKPTYHVLLRPIIEVATQTTLRIGDVLSLSWDRVHFDNSEIHVTQKKTGKKIIVPIGDLLSEILKSIPQNPDSPYVFNWEGKRVSQNGWLKSQFKKACANAELKDVRVHDLRRTGATHSQDSASLDTIQNQLGHESKQMTRNYVRPKTSVLKKSQDNMVNVLYSASLRDKLRDKTPFYGPFEGAESNLEKDKTADIQPILIYRRRGGTADASDSKSPEPSVDNISYDDKSSSHTLSHNVTNPPKTGPS